MSWNKKIGRRILANGIVQGVGFRPFIFSQASRYHLTGWVRNTTLGVEIEINGAEDDIFTFLANFRSELPPLARIDQLVVTEQEFKPSLTFEIIQSSIDTKSKIIITPDVAICPDCQREMSDPNNRRYRYPFINCTNCGPRFSIIKNMPYDRQNTTMSTFQLCSECQAEYNDPFNRRFHAQPIACPKCGPNVWFEKDGKKCCVDESAIQISRQLLMDGKILAIKGLGGFHLACDATNCDAVEQLRKRKKRSDKPFALMVFDMQTAEKHCRLSRVEAEYLISPQHPILILDRLSHSNICELVAPNQTTVGIMLPYTPLHLLLMEPSDGFPEILVMTSGNLSEEPIAYRDDEALERLGGMADGFLLHNRPIYMRMDDSVIRVVDDHPFHLRRSRGFSPAPFMLPTSKRSILAVGAELKNTFCLSDQDNKIVSHHIGDLENFETYKAFEEGIAHFERLYKITPEILACDLHPDYLSTRYSVERAENENIPLIQIQHHHAHLASCLADNEWRRDEPVIGLCFDGTGLGTDSAIWGGEIIIGGYKEYQRFAHLQYFPLPGGDTCIHKPARTGLALLWSSGLQWDTAQYPLNFHNPDELSAILWQMENRINSPLTSSMGRLFDGVASLLGICQVATYEGQAAIELETIANPDETDFYDFPFQNGLLLYPSLISALIKDLKSGNSKSNISARFHNSIAIACLEICKSIKMKFGINTVAFSGGVWQNSFLTRKTMNYLQASDFSVLVHQKVPANDGGISLGQVMVAANSF